ncbi:hypothetical protein PISL3812_09464 [Talaromyces islandicus]|uniref:AB hydrolase-1 domain-containing protein n=1 Tax=Talaromyces islandicus TaxID=28573 RepID=A0A0U1MA08_TALIS|nr:hypothetical protein PISL3812_09464 [Talaromyces islandicus]
MPSKPSIVIIPGSFSGPELYTILGSQLVGHGYEVFVGALQSASHTPPERPATMKEDAAYFRGIAEFLASQGKDVVVLGHSYGGIVATECVKGVTRAERKEQGKPGGVVRVVYLASVIGDVGQGSLEAMGGQLGPFIRTLGDYMHMDGNAAAPVIYNDLPEKEALEWANRGRCHSTTSFLDPLTFTAVDHVPVTYIHTARDSILIPEYQKASVEKLKKQNAKNVSTVTINTGHMPNVTAPEVTAKGVIEAISAA